MKKEYSAPCIEAIAIESDCSMLVGTVNGTGGLTPGGGHITIDPDSGEGGEGGEGGDGEGYDPWGGAM